LDPAKAQSQNAGEASDRGGLCQSGNALDEHVALAGERNEQSVNKLGLADEDPSHLAPDSLDDLAHPTSAGVPSDPLVPQASG
jgi:hypothetical protein